MPPRTGADAFENAIAASRPRPRLKLKPAPTVQRAGHADAVRRRLVARIIGEAAAIVTVDLQGHKPTACEALVKTSCRLAGAQPARCLARQRCIRLIAALMLTVNVSAVTRRDEPYSTASTIRSRRSSDKGLAVHAGLHIPV
jgi:hypothetical protein